jgi:Cu-Zn family superoxide dismutase
MGCTPTTRMKAVAVVQTGEIQGYVEFKEVKSRTSLKLNTKICVKLNGLPPGKHALHIHRTGDLRRGCSSLCEHFNPDKCDHGGPNDTCRHAGDLGNIIADENGTVDTEFIDKIIKLRGCKYNIIGRSIIIHEHEDDLGRGLDAESLKTGNAGRRIACGVIGHSE